MIHFLAVTSVERDTTKVREPLGGAHLHAYLGTAAAVLALVAATTSAVVPMIHRHDYVSAIVFCVVAIGTAAVAAASLLPRSAARRLETTERFRACGELEGTQIWRRPRMLNVLEEKIGDGGIVVVVGPSGAGKSVLLRDLLRGQLTNIALIYCSQHGEWPTPNEASGRVVVLDQFEHALLGLPWGTKVAKERLDEIHDEVVALQRCSRAVILGIREDWYIKLAFLKDLLPSLNDSTLLSYVGSELDSDVEQAFRKKLLDLDPQIPVPPIPEGATPMDLQALGQLHELAMQDRTISFAGGAFPSVTSAVSELTRLIATRANSRNAVLKTLHALKSAREGGGALTPPQIVATTGDFDEAVAESIDYLESAGLVTSLGPKVELTHDALMASVERVTSDYLDPAERDNIRRGAQDLRSLVPPQARSALIPWFVIALIVALVTARAVIPADGVWYKLSALSAPKRTGVLDPLYLLVAIPHLIWCYYIVRYHIDIYRYCDNSRWQTFLSYCNTFLLVGVIAWGMFAIEWWACAIAVGGLMQATKVLAYGRDTRRPLASRRLFETYAKRTFNNCTVLLALGTVFAVAVPHAHWSQHGLRWAYLFGSLVLTNAALYLYNQGLTSDATARARGFLSRQVPRDAARAQNDSLPQAVTSQ